MRENNQKKMQKIVDRAKELWYNTPENKEGRCIRLTSSNGKEVNNVFFTGYPQRWFVVARVPEGSRVL